MNKQSSLFLKYIFPFVLIPPVLGFIFADIFLKGNNFVSAGLKEKNHQDIIHNSFEENDDDSAFPTNPMELINVLRTIEEMNDRTDPSDAIDDALKAFESKDNEAFTFEGQN